MDPATAAAMASMMQSIIGTKQLGAVAPAFQGGGGGLPLGAQIGGSGLGQKLASITGSNQFEDIEQAPSGLLGPAQTQVAPEQPVQLPQPLPAPQGIGGDPMGPPAPPAPQPSLMGPPSDLANPASDDEQKFNPFSGFFGNLDKRLQSPSQQILLGLLGQQDPRLAVGGLLAGGLFGENKVF